MIRIRPGFLFEPLAVLASCAGGPAYAQGIIATLAGADLGFTGDGRPAAQAALGVIPGIATDSRGNLFLTDTENHLLLRVGPDGILRVVAGNGIPGHSGDGGPAASASLGGPAAVAVDHLGNVYVSEGFSHRIRKISPAGIITTYAGSGRPDTSGDGGPAALAGIGGEVFGMVCDASGALYLAQKNEHVVRKIASDGTISTVAGTGQPGYSGDGGPADQALLAAPMGLVFDAAGNLLIADSGNFRIRAVSPVGAITTLAGGGFFPGDGIPASAALLMPMGLAADRAGNVYLADHLTARVRRVDTRGIVTTVAGSGLRGFSGDGGPALAASLTSAFGVAIDPSGNIYAADAGDSRVRKITPEGVISTVAGNGGPAAPPDGSAGVDTGLRLPWDLSAGSNGSVLLCERAGARIRRIGADGRVTTIAGTGRTGVMPDGANARNGETLLPGGVAEDSAGNVLFAEVLNFRVRKVAPDGTISTAAGNGLPSATPSNDVPANTSPLGIVSHVAFDPAGNLYISDEGQNVIRKVAANGIITTVAGNGRRGFSGDGGPALSASLHRPGGLAVDASGTIYFADVGNLRVRKVTAAGVISTVAGTGVAAYSGEGGPAASASLSPHGVVLDPEGNLFVSDPANHRILRIARSGAITTVAGTGQPGSAGDGGPARLAALNNPHGVAVDARGNLYIADTGNARVRVVLAAAASFSVSVSELSFRGSSTGARTRGQSVQVTGSLAGLPFTATPSGNASEWLRVTPANGTMPREIELAADPGKLDPGDYRGTLTITAAGAEPRSRTITVTFRVDPAEPPSLQVGAQSLSMAAVEGQGRTSAAVELENSGGGAIVVTAEVAGGAWLSAAPGRLDLSSSAPGSLTVEADPQGLAPGTYAGEISLTASTGQTATIPVSFVVSPARQQLLLTSSGFTFQAVAGGGVIPPESFGIANSGDGALDWTAEPRPAWLTLSASSGSSVSGGMTPEVTASASAGSLPPGTYYDRITVSAPRAENAPQVVTAVLNVAPPDQSPGPVVRPAGLLFTAVAGGPSPGSQTVRIYNPGTAPVSFNSNRLTLDGNNWFVHLPTSGVAPTGEPVSITVQPNVSGLSAGIYSAVMTLLFPGGGVRTVNLLFVVAAQPGAADQSRSRAVDACAPAKLAPLILSLSSGAAGLVGWPTPLTVKVVDDCGEPVVAGSVTASFANGDPPLALTPVNDGVWSATWTPRQSQASGVTITVRAQSRDGLTGQAQVTVQAPSAAGAPVLRTIVNTGGSGVPLAPGSRVAIRGSGLAPAPVAAGDPPLPLELMGTSVVMAGRQLPLLAVNDGQVDFLIPYDMAFNTTQQLVLLAGARLSVPEPVAVAPAKPVILTTGDTGQAKAYIITGGGRTPVDAANPVSAGDEILVEATGLGPVDPAVDSRAAPSLPAPKLRNPAAMTIGGVEAEVSFAGLSPDSPGVYHVRAIAPAGVASGSAPIRLAVAGAISPPAVISIK